jgi:hypothetical protein
MNYSTRSTGRHDLSAGYGRIGELAVPTDQQIVDMASLPDYVVLTVDGIRFDAKKIISLMAGEEMQYVLQASQHDRLLMHVNETSLAGRRTIPLRELVVDGKLYTDNKCFDLHLIETRMMGIQQTLEAEPTPVDLGSLPSETIITVDNHKVKAGKLYKLLIAAENKGQILPVKQSKFDASVIDTAEDRGFTFGYVSLDSLKIDDVYWLNGQEFDGIDIERLIDLNLRKLSPNSPYRSFVYSMKTTREGFEADAKAFHKKYSGLTMLLITLLTASVAIRILKFTDLVDTIGRNMLVYMQGYVVGTYGNTPTAIALGGSNMELALGLIDLVFIALGSYVGYHITHKSRKPLLNIPLGVLAGILVFRGVQLIVFVAFASTLH